MNEPIMRRGLSPEGRRIRDRHQGSLLNDEFGVTSQPIHKKIEKDFLKENIMRLREIQAKCRTQESRPISGNQPVKAIRPRVAALPLDHIKTTTSIEADECLSLKLREGSAHSDYFSLPDDSQHESEQAIHQSNIVHSNEPFRERDEIRNENVLLLKDNNKYSSHNVLESNHPSNNVNYSSKHSFKSFNNVPLTQLKPFSPKETDPNTKFTNSSTKFRDFYPHSLRRSKIGNIIERIKSKKPACDTNTNVIWRDIEKQHKAFFPDELSSNLSTPRTLNAFNKNVTSDSKGQTSEKKQTSLARSQSLDRGSHYKANLKSIPLNNSTYTLYPRPKSSSMNLIDLEQNLKVEPLPPPPPHSPSPQPPYKMKEHPSILQVGSLPNLSNERGTTMNHSNLAVNPYSSTRNTTLSPSLLNNTKGMQYLGDDTPYSKDLDNSDDVPLNSHGDCSSDISVGSNADTEESGRKELGVVPIITKRDASIQTSKQPLLVKSRPNLLRSKSSSNLYLTGEPPPSYKRGHIPKYLKSRKAESLRRMEAAASVDPLCPPGHTPLPDHERRNTLHLLKKGQADMMQQLCSLPLAQDTLRVRKLKQDLEAKLEQIEEGIEIFSQSKVYVVNDE